MRFLSPLLWLEVHLGSTGIILLTAGRMDLGLTPYRAPATASLVAPEGLLCRSSISQTHLQHPQTSSGCATSKQPP